MDTLECTDIVGPDKHPIAILLYGSSAFIGGYVPHGEQERSPHGVLYHPFRFTEGMRPRQDGGADVSVVLRKLLMSRETPDTLTIGAPPLAVLLLSIKQPDDKKIAEAYSHAVEEEALKKSGLVAPPGGFRLPPGGMPPGMGPRR